MKFPKKIFLLVSVLLFTLAILVSCNDKKEDESKNTECTQVIVSTAEDLFALSKYVGESSKNVVITLANDIDLSQNKDAWGRIIDWIPIGSTLDNAFQGTLNGAGYTITGLTLQGWVTEKYSGQAYTVDEKGNYVPINGENSFLPQTVTYYEKKGDGVYEVVPSSLPFDEDKIYYIKDNLGKYIEYGIDNLDSIGVKSQLYKKVDDDYEPIGEGTPLYIAKRIIGWDANGNAVYKSGEIVGFERDKDGTITDVIYEGSNSDPKYATITRESTSTSFGSVGFFGYTHGATIQDITFDQADISFYASSEKTYAGIVSGYDVGSTFKNVNVSNSSLLASHLYDKEIIYSTKYATPTSYENQPKSTAIEYMGGVVGYSQYDTTTQNGYSVKYTLLNEVHVTDLVIDNCQYSAYFDMGVTVADASDASISHFESTYITGKGCYSMTSLAKSSSVIEYMLPREAYIGGVAGYLKESDYRNLKKENYVTEYVVKKVSADGINLPKSGRPHAGVGAQKLNAGGISAYLTGGKSEDLTVQNIYWESINQSGNYLVSDSAYVGGAFAMIQSSEVVGTSVQNVSLNMQERSAQSICVGGFAGYAEGNSDITNITAEKVDIETSYTDNGELGAILGGLCGAVRDSSLTGTNSAKEIRFKVDTGSKESDYKYVSALVAQVYGNSHYTGGTIDKCSYYRSNCYGAFTQQKSHVYANNYVNENGEGSVRLYYLQNGRYAGVYVTVFGELVKKANIGTNVCTLYEEKMWEQINATDLPMNGKKIDINNAKETYAYFAENGQKWNKLTSNSTDENLTVKEERRYAKEVTLLRVDSDGLVGKDLNGLGLCIYDEKTGVVTSVSAGTVSADQTYYVRPEAVTVSGYELRITVYAENGDILVLEKGKTEEEDKLAEEIGYSVTSEQYEECSQKVGCVAEQFLSIYFEKGFKQSKNCIFIVDTEKSRDFTQYDIVTGRAEVSEGFAVE